MLFGIYICEQEIWWVLVFLRKIDPRACDKNEASLPFLSFSLPSASPLPPRTLQGGSWDDFSLFPPPH